MAGYRMDGHLPEGDVYDREWEALAAWFLGPKGENSELMKELVVESFNSHADFREEFYQTDSKYITESLQASEAYRSETEQMRVELDRINKDLQQSVPFFSHRYQGHMLWDTSIPGKVGYIAGMLYNQNNCAAESSPVTTLMELEVGEQLCEMLGYKIDSPAPWGHLTCGGTVANIEAMWAARNLKFLPLAVQAALKDEPDFSNAAEFKVFVPRLGRQEAVKHLDAWDLLNLRTDDVIEMTNRLAEEHNMDIEVVSKMVKKNSLQRLGMARFMIQNNLNHHPVILAPASSHYSWTKGMTLLGLGDEQLVPVAVDETGRQDMSSLREILNNCLRRKQPVMMVVSVMGTTEEGAIDPLVDILKMKDDFEKRGLCFCVHADAAWGGYLCTLLDETLPTIFFNRQISCSIPFVFSSPLNAHSKKNLQAMKFVDSITVDPHKTGFLPYPAGGLCYRNGSMRNLVTLAAPVVFHGGSDPNIGVYGIEGSKPGASAVATLYSHRVIGQKGYRRIFSQCITGAKMFYLLWLTIAQDDDPFDCVPIVPLPTGISLEAARNCVRKMANKQCSDMLKDSSDYELFEVIGGDAMVNAFMINIKGNKHVAIANKLTELVFKKLSFSNAITDSNKRIPLFLTQSERNATIGVVSLRKLKKKVGLNYNDDNLPVSFLINTVLNPWISSYKMVAEFGQSFRETVLLAIGEMMDDPNKHDFVSAGLICEDGLIFGDYIPVFMDTLHQYHAIAKFKIHDKEAIKKFTEKQLHLLNLPEEERVPVIFRNIEPYTLPGFVQSQNQVLSVRCFAGFPSETNAAFLETEMSVEDVSRLTHFGMTCKEYPDCLQYWMFGDKNGAYMSHIMTLRPDMHQVVALASIPRRVDIELLELGFLIEIPSVGGKPLFANDVQIDPLLQEEYTFNFTGRLGEVIKSTLFIAKKIWTNFDLLNQENYDCTTPSSMNLKEVKEKQGASGGQDSSDE